MERERSACLSTVLLQKGDSSEEICTPLSAQYTSSGKKSKFGNFMIVLQLILAHVCL